MKKLSLLKMSHTNLDRIQQEAITGGAICACVCAYICTACGCPNPDQQAISQAEEQGNTTGEKQGADMTDGNYITP